MGANRTGALLVVGIAAAWTTPALGTTASSAAASSAAASVDLAAHSALQQGIDVYGVRLQEIPNADPPGGPSVRSQVQLDNSKSGLPRQIWVGAEVRSFRTPRRAYRLQVDLLQLARSGLAYTPVGQPIKIASIALGVIDGLRDPLLSALQSQQSQRSQRALTPRGEPPRWAFWPGQQPGRDVWFGQWDHQRIGGGVLIGDDLFGRPGELDQRDWRLSTTLDLEAIGAVLHCLAQLRDNDNHRYEQVGERRAYALAACSAGQGH